MNLEKLNIEVMALKQEMARMKSIIGFREGNLNEELKSWELAGLEDLKSFEKQI